MRHRFFVIHSTVKITPSKKVALASPHRGPLWSEIKPLLLVLNPTFFFFLIFYIFFYGFLIQTNSAHKITSSPKMIPPVRLFLQSRVTLEKFYSYFPFQCAHQF